MRPEKLDSLTRIRRIRHELSLEHGHDPQRIVAHYLALQDAASARKPGARPARSPKARRSSGLAKP